MPAMTMHHDVDPRDEILARIGDVSNVEIFHNQVMVAVYMRPKDGKTKGGIYLPQQHTDEDRYQSKVGLLVKMGPRAFEPGGSWFEDTNAFVLNEDWLVFRPSDTWQITVNGVLCRVIMDVDVRGRVQHPDMVW